ncbi:hypothetical protein B0H19DRAFT_1294604 [Mycena capillaripes]|nr:hypothetical protein B0H19DRAFT_1294604 [Mycena capillaripes]
MVSGLGEIAATWAPDKNAAKVLKSRVSEQGERCAMIASANARSKPRRSITEEAATSCRVQSKRVGMPRATGGRDRIERLGCPEADGANDEKARPAKCALLRLIFDSGLTLGFPTSRRSGICITCDLLFNNRVPSANSSRGRFIKRGIPQFVGLALISSVELCFNAGSVWFPRSGLLRDSDEKITSVSGGCAPSRSWLAMNLFSSQWPDLPEEQRHQWKIGWTVGAVIPGSFLCDARTYDGDKPQPCAECEGLHKLHISGIAFNRPMTDDGFNEICARGVPRPRAEHLVFGIASVDWIGESIWIRKDIFVAISYRMMVVLRGSGMYRRCLQFTHPTVMVKAMVLKFARMQKGNSLKNIRYPAEFDQFWNLSPRFHIASRVPYIPDWTRPACLPYVMFFWILPRFIFCSATRAKFLCFKPDFSTFNGATAVDTLRSLNIMARLCSRETILS